MFAKNPKINHLILKWSNDIFGNWRQVEEDLIELEKQIREDERQKMGFFDPVKKNDLHVPFKRKY